MNQRRAGVIAILFLFALGAVWAFAGSVSKNTNATSTSEITVTHTREGNLEHYTGVLPTKAPCDAVTGIISIEGGGHNAHIDLSVTRLPGVMCADSPSNAAFSFGISSIEPLTGFSLTLDGKPLPSVLVEK